MGAHLLYTAAKKRKDGNPQSFQECHVRKKGGSRMERRRKQFERIVRLDPRSFRNMRNVCATDVSNSQVNARKKNKQNRNNGA